MTQDDFSDECESDQFDDFIARVAATDAHARPSTNVHSGDVLAKRFVISRKLGSGGMGQVFAAFDRDQGYEVALKVIGSVTPRSLEQLKREFRSACELVHPNLVRLHELFVDESELFFTMDLIDGKPLPELIEPGSRERTEQLREVFRQLAAAIEALHAAGTLHRDLKPSNFLVEVGSERVTLLDFGLAHPIGGSEGLPAGTPAYMAPEQRLCEALTEATDWYSFGVVLYEALSGQLPRSRPSAEQLSGQPEDLKQLCLQLLHLDPSSRPGASRVREVLGAHLQPGYSVPPSRRNELVGRESELRDLADAYETILRGRTATVLIDGPSGIGKTALLESFLDHLASPRLVMLSSRCRERESMSYKAIDGLIDGLVLKLDSLPESEAQELLPAGIAQLTLLFPGLRAASAISKLSGRTFSELDQSNVRDQGIVAFGELLRNLRALGPLVIWIDDLQWSDAESALLLAPVLSGALAVPLLFVGTQRSRMGEDGPLVRALAAASALLTPSRLTLDPLLAEDAERLAYGVLVGRAEGAREVARSIAHDAGGHPLFIAELAHGVASRGSAWRSAPATLMALVAERIATLDADARLALELSAVAGTPLSRSELRAALGRGHKVATIGIDCLKGLRLVRTQGLLDDDAVELQHDRIREIVIEALDLRRRMQHHARLATTLEQDPRTSPERIALHLEAAGEPVRAAQYFLTAADRAFNAFAFSHAASLYARGLAHARIDDDTLKALRVRRAQALAHAGRSVAAADAYLTLAANASTLERTELQRRGAEQLLLAGELERGVEVIQQVLRHIDMRPLRSGLRALLSIAVGRAKVRARGMRHELREEATLPPEELARLDASWTISCSLSMIDPICGADFQNDHLLLALKAGEPKRLLRALTLEASYAAAPGSGSEQRAAKLLELAQQLAEGSTDHAALGLLNLARGMVEYLQGRTARALPHFRDALSCFQERCAGAVWETMSAQRFIVASLFFLGRLRELGELVPQILAQSEGRTTRYTTLCFCSAYSTLAWLVQDDGGAAERQLALAREQCSARQFHLSHFNLLIGETYLDFYLQRPIRARQRMLDRWREVESSQLLKVGVLRVQMWHLRGTACILAAAEQERAGDLLEARRLRGEALKIARRLAGERFPRAVPLAAVLTAAVECSRGNVSLARRTLVDAIRAFANQGLTLYEAAAKIRFGELRQSDAGELLIRDGLACFQKEGARNPTRILDVFAPPLIVGAISPARARPMLDLGRSESPSEAKLLAGESAQ